MIIWTQRFLLSASGHTTPPFLVVYISDPWKVHPSSFLSCDISPWHLGFPDVHSGWESSTGSISQGGSFLLTMKLFSPLHLPNVLRLPRRMPSYPATGARIPLLPKSQKQTPLTSCWHFLPGLIWSHSLILYLFQRAPREQLICKARMMGASSTKQSEFSSISVPSHPPLHVLFDDS